MNYSQLNLNEKLFQGISAAGYVECTPVQEQVLKISLDGSDLYVQSQTGTGKTAAFLVTIMQQLLSGGKDAKKNALIMVPTRELAVQVEDEAKKLGKFTGLTCASFYGGVGYEKQIAKLSSGVDIYIGTPGRIIDLNESKKMDLSHVAYLAIDEADRMFDMGFYPDLRKIVKLLPSSDSRQTMLFSATLNSYVKNLAWEYTKDAKEITIEAQNLTVDEIEQELIHVSSDDKIRLLMGIVAREKPESLIIFCNTKKMCEILSKRLVLNGIKNEFIIGDLPQPKRLKIMNDFKSGKINCLIATDVAARGIDVNDLAMVVNFDLPNEAENYVHRIGRTARAGKTGKAYSFCGETQDDAFNLMGIEKYIARKIPFIVASQEDFGEDKSSGVYIRLDSDERHDRKSDSKQKSFRGKKNRAEKETRSLRNKSHDKKDFSSFKGNNARNTVRRANDEEISKLSYMSSDERLKYFKEKYAKSSSYSPKNNGAYKKNHTNKKIERQKTKNTENHSEKLGFFGRLKSLIGRKK